MFVASLPLSLPPSLSPPSLPLSLSGTTVRQFFCRLQSDQAYSLTTSLGCTLCHVSTLCLGCLSGSKGDTVGAMMKILKNRKAISFEGIFLMYPMHKVSLTAYRTFAMPLTTCAV